MKKKNVIIKFIILTISRFYFFKVYTIVQLVNKKNIKNIFRNL